MSRMERKRGPDGLFQIAWARRLGMKQPTLWRRLKAGWTVERALSTPVQGGR